MKNKPKRYLIIGVIIVAVLLFGFKTFNDNKEKSLNELFVYNPSSFDSLLFQLDGNNSWETDKKEAAEELMEFLSQYKVKKMKEYEWNGDVSKEKGFVFTIYSKGKPVGGSIFESRMNLYHTGYYNVVNGPIDMDWIQKYFELYRN